MSGCIVYTAPDTPEPHRCEPPITDNLLMPEPSVPLGSIWRCDCGRYWTATDTGWRPAKRRERRRVEPRGSGLMQVVAADVTPVPYPVDDEHPPTDFDG